MSGRPGAFHHKHGRNIRLSEEDTVAHRVDSYNKAVVFTEQPIPLGAMFQVRLLDKGGGWAGSIVSSRRLETSRALLINAHPYTTLLSPSLPSGSRGLDSLCAVPIPSQSPVEPWTCTGTATTGFSLQARSTTTVRRGRWTLTLSS